MTAPARLAIVYASDEDLAIGCEGDVAVLTPDAQLLAAGSDGVFDASDPWTLASASNDFEAQGLKVGNMVRLISAVDSATSKKILPFGASGVLMAVGSVSGNSVTLRRAGFDDGVGRPPGVGGFTGVSFASESLYPQIEQASDELNRRFGLDPRSSTRSPAMLYDDRELREACMLIVLVNRYIGALRTENGAYPIKIKEATAARDESLARLQVRFGDVPDAPPPTPFRFGSRIGR